MYFPVRCLVKYFHIIRLIVRFHRSTTHDFSSFSVQYKCTFLLANNSFMGPLSNSRPLSVHKNLGGLTPDFHNFLKAFTISSALLFLKGIQYPIFEKTSIIISRKTKPLLTGAKYFISTKSAAQISPGLAAKTLRFLKCFLTGL